MLKFLQIYYLNQNFRNELEMSLKFFIFGAPIEYLKKLIKWK